MQRWCKIYSWSMYDWANSAFATAVMASFFPVMFRRYWSVSADVTVATFRLGVANSLASVFIAFTAPVLGAISDRLHARKISLAIFACLGVVMTGGMFFVPKGDYQVAGLMYVLATVGFLGGNVFYDSLLLDVAPPGGMNRVSALGYALGYMGGGLLFAICVAMIMRPTFFGFSGKAMATRAVFALTAIWWGIFSLPLILFVRERGKRAGNRATKWRRSLAKTLQQMASDRNIWLFLIGYWLYIDGVGTIVRMAMDFGLSIGLKERDLILALGMTQFIAFPATLMYGKVGDWLGARQAILLGLCGYLLISIGSLFVTSARGFYLLAGGVGLFQGGVQSLSRAFFGHLIPRGQEASYFGVYNMLGRFAAVLGPFLMGVTAYWTKSTRMGVLAVALLFLGGAFFLGQVREKPREIKNYF